MTQPALKKVSMIREYSHNSIETVLGLLKISLLKTSTQTRRRSPTRLISATTWKNHERWFIPEHVARMIFCIF